MVLLSYAGLTILLLVAWIELLVICWSSLSNFKPTLKIICYALILVAAISAFWFVYYLAHLYGVVP